MSTERIESALFRPHETQRERRCNLIDLLVAVTATAAATTILFWTVWR